MENLTSAQFDVLSELIAGQVPRAMDPIRTFGAMVKRGLMAEYVKPGTHWVSYRITQKGLDAYVAEITARHNTAVRRLERSYNAPSAE